MKENIEKLKNTKSRETILSVIKDSKVPLSALDIFDKLRSDGITLSTIYRTLDTFYKNDILIKETDINGTNLYTIHSENHNHYLECKQCHKRTELHYCPYHDINENIKNDLQFEVDEHNMVIYGLCKDCKPTE